MRLFGGKKKRVSKLLPRIIDGMIRHARKNSNDITSFDKFIR